MYHPELLVNDGGQFRGYKTMINPQNQTLEETTPLKQELNSLIERARRAANACKQQYNSDWEGKCEDDWIASAEPGHVEDLLNRARECAQYAGRDIKSVVDEIMQIAYEGAVQHEIIWAEACRSINPHNARVGLRMAKYWAQKANIDITLQIQELEAELEPKKPKIELIQESEIPISGVNFVPFEEYKRLGGKLTEVQYEQVKRVRISQDLYRQAFKEASSAGGGYPPEPEMELLARIIAIVPNLSSFDKVCEMLLLQGKK